MRFSASFLVFIFLTSNSFAGFDTSHINIHILVEEADIVLDVNPKDIKIKNAKGDWADEIYSVVKLEGRYLSPTGEKRIPGIYHLRLPGDRTEQFADAGRLIIFLKGNGEVNNPLLGREAIFNVDIDGGVSNISGDPIIGITKYGMPYYERGFNTCSLADAPEMAGAEHDSEGNIVKELARDELLETLESFECPDGTQWWRGADRPNDYVSPPQISVNEFNSVIVDHLDKLNLPPPEVNKGLAYPKHITLKKWSTLKGYEEHDQSIITLMSDSDEIVDAMPERMLLPLYQRQKLRGKSKQLPKKAIERAEKLVIEKNKKEKE